MFVLFRFLLYMLKKKMKIVTIVSKLFLKSKALDIPSECFWIYHRTFTRKISILHQFCLVISFHFDFQMTFTDIYFTLVTVGSAE